MRGPPPQRNPPVPPLTQDQATTAYIADDSQYDEPGVPSEVKECYEGSVSSRQRFKLLNNNYEISTSQQIRTFAPIRNVRLGQKQQPEPVSPWGDESRQMLLQNPETGSYYIPTSSGKLFFLNIFLVVRSEAPQEQEKKNGWICFYKELSAEGIDFPLLHTSGASNDSL
uniref:Uncharacterized protein n=1 Tax=Setaria digitata TaxID=48799 RepID=A0A915PJ74_9BILA